MKRRILVHASLLVSFALVAGCGGSSSASTSPPPAAGPTNPPPTLTPAATVPSPTHLPPTATPSPARSVDLVAFDPARQGSWFSVNLEEFPESIVEPEATFVVRGTALPNRRDGEIASTLAAHYVFLQFGDVRTSLIERHASTMRALFIRSALMSFVDYLGGNVLDWDGRSSRIPLDIEQVIAFCNRLNIPVYLELNYSDYIAGPLGSGVESLQPADNIGRTVEYLEKLRAKGLRVAGVTFGDEIGDHAGFGAKKPTTLSDDIPARYIAFARALKEAFPQLGLYAFDSYISAARGQLSENFDLLERVRAAEIEDGRPLIDGFLFRESYVYINSNGNLRESWKIIDDTDSLYEASPVYRYDSFGRFFPEADKDYLHTVIARTEEIFDRPLEIGLSEYLPAGPVEIDESDTSPYADIDFILHYADVMGIYATLGLDYVSTFLFANSPEQAKCYLDRQGHEGPNYPVFAQIAENLKGELLRVEDERGEEAERIRVYASRHDSRTFVMILNREVGRKENVRVILPGQGDLILRLPARSYTSLIWDGESVLVSGIGG